jgi:hypothetical protein
VHLNTRSYSKHVALNTFYDTVIDHADAFAEAYQGRHGLIGPITLHSAKKTTNITEFLVQVGKGRGAYSTRYKFVGDLAQAVFYYRGINIGNGYKKRLYAPSFNRKTIAKQSS